MPPRSLLLTATSGFIAVLLGALGAHALRPKLLAKGTLDAWNTAAHYHLLHTVACLALLAWASAQPTRAAQFARIHTAWLLGCLLFAGSIYILALGGPRYLGPVTPLGGLFFLAGWVLLAREAYRKN